MNNIFEIDCNTRERDNINEIYSGTSRCIQMPLTIRKITIKSDECSDEFDLVTAMRMKFNVKCNGGIITNTIDSFIIRAFISGKCKWKKNTVKLRYSKHMWWLGGLYDPLTKINLCVCISASIPVKMIIKFGKPKFPTVVPRIYEYFWCIPCNFVVLMIDSINEEYLTRDENAKYRLFKRYIGNYILCILYPLQHTEITNEKDALHIEEKIVFDGTTELMRVIYFLRLVDISMQS